MDSKLLFWTGALALLALVVGCGFVGVRAVQRGDVRVHRASMLGCAGLVGLFLVAYLAKVATLGKEDRSEWTALDHAALYAHELCIAVMLVAGGVALGAGLRFGDRVGAQRPPPSAPLPGRLLHRRAGRVAAVAGLLAFATAVGVWSGMWVRAA